MDRLQKYFDFAPYLIFAVFFVFSVYQYNQAAESLDNEIKNTFRITTRELASNINARMETYEQILRGGQGFYAANGNRVDSKMWTDYISSLQLQKKYPGIQAIGFVETVKKENAQKHIELMRKSGIEGYSIKPSAERERMAVVAVMYPETAENLRVLGYDLSSEPVRAKMLAYAEKSGKTGISGKMVLKQELNEKSAPAGILMALPMYENGELYGYIAAPFRVNRLMEGIFGNRMKGISFRLYDNEHKEQNLMFSSDEDTEPAVRFSCDIPLDIYGREWILNFTARKEFLNQFDHSKPIIILIFGLITGTLLAFLVFMLLKTRSQAFHIAEQTAGKLRESEERYKITFEQVAVGIVIVGADGCIRRANRYFAKIAGFEPEETKGLLFFGLIDGMTEQGADEIIAGLKNRDTGTYEAEKIIRRKDGKEIWTDITFSPLFSKEGELLYFLAAVEDISRRKEAELLLKELNSNLEQKISQETVKRIEQERLLMRQSRLAAMGEMIGAIAHQWRQPLNIMSLMVQNVHDDFLENSLTEETMDEFVENCMEQLGYMSATIDDFRNFFRSEKERTVFSPYIQTESVIKLMASQMQSRNIDIKMAENGSGLVWGVPNEFSQVLLNLINNSKDAFAAAKTADPCINISIESIDTEIIITVTDNGGGIPESIAEKVFDPYFTTKGPDKGTGIGLYMSKLIIHDHFKGSLDFRNTETGAEFIITVPKAGDKL